MQKYYEKMKRGDQDNTLVNTMRSIVNGDQVYTPTVSKHQGKLQVVSGDETLMAFRVLKDLGLTDKNPKVINVDFDINLEQEKYKQEQEKSLSAADEMIRNSLSSWNSFGKPHSTGNEKRAGGSSFFGDLVGSIFGFKDKKPTTSPNNVNQTPGVVNETLEVPTQIISPIKYNPRNNTEDEKKIGSKSYLNMANTLWEYKENDIVTSEVKREFQRGMKEIQDTTKEKGLTKKEAIERLGRIWDNNQKTKNNIPIITAAHYIGATKEDFINAVLYHDFSKKTQPSTKANNLKTEWEKDLVGALSADDAINVINNSINTISLEKIKDLVQLNTKIKQEEREKIEGYVQKIEDDRLNKQQKQYPAQKIEKRLERLRSLENKIKTSNLNNLEGLSEEEQKQEIEKDKKTSIRNKKNLNKYKNMSYRYFSSVPLKLLKYYNENNLISKDNFGVVNNIVAYKEAKGEVEAILNQEINNPQKKEDFDQKMLKLNDKYGSDIVSNVKNDIEIKNRNKSSLSIDKDIISQKVDSVTSFKEAIASNDIASLGKINKNRAKILSGGDVDLYFSWFKGNAKHLLDSKKISEDEYKSRVDFADNKIQERKIIISKKAETGDRIETILVTDKNNPTTITLDDIKNLKNIRDFINNGGKVTDEVRSSIANIDKYAWERLHLSGEVSKDDYKYIKSRVFPKYKSGEKRPKEESLKSLTDQESARVETVAHISRNFFQSSFYDLKKDPKILERFNNYKDKKVDDVFRSFGLFTPQDIFVGDRSKGLTEIDIEKLKAMSIPEEKKEKILNKISSIDPYSLLGKFLYKISSKDRKRDIFNEVSGALGFDISKIDIDNLGMHIGPHIIESEQGQKATLGFMMEFFKNNPYVKLGDELSKNFGFDVEKEEDGGPTDREIIKQQILEEQKIEDFEKLSSKEQDKINELIDKRIEQHENELPNYFDPFKDVDVEHDYFLEDKSEEDEYNEKLKLQNLGVSSLDPEDKRAPWLKKPKFRGKAQLSDFVSCLFKGINPFHYNHNMYDMMKDFLSKDVKNKILGSSQNIGRVDFDKVDVSEDYLKNISKFDPYELSFLTNIGGNMGDMFRDVFVAIDESGEDEDKKLNKFLEISKKYNLPTNVKMGEEEYFIYDIGMYEYYKGEEEDTPTLSEDYAAQKLKDITPGPPTTIIFVGEYEKREDIDKVVLNSSNNPVYNVRPIKQKIKKEIDNNNFLKSSGIEYNEEQKDKILDILNKNIDIEKIKKEILSVLSIKDKIKKENVEWELDVIYNKEGAPKNSSKRKMYNFMTSMRVVSNNIDDVDGDRSLTMSEVANKDGSQKLKEKRARLWLSLIQPIKGVDRDEAFEKTMEAFNVTYPEIKNAERAIDEGRETWRDEDGNKIRISDEAKDYLKYKGTLKNLEEIVKSVYETGEMFDPYGKSVVYSKDVDGKQIIKKTGVQGTLTERFVEIRDQLLVFAKQNFKMSDKELSDYKKNIEEKTKEVVDRYLKKEVNIFNKNREFLKRGENKAYFLELNDDIAIIDNDQEYEDNQSVIKRYSVFEVSKKDNTPIKMRRAVRENPDGSIVYETINNPAVSSALNIKATEIIGGHKDPALTQEYLKNLSRQYKYKSDWDNVIYNDPIEQRDSEIEKVILKTAMGDDNWDIKDIPSEDLSLLISFFDDPSYLDSINSELWNSRSKTVKDINEHKIETTANKDKIENFVTEKILQIMDPKNTESLALELSNFVRVEKQTNRNYYIEKYGKEYEGVVFEKIKEIFKNYKISDKEIGSIFKQDNLNDMLSVDFDKLLLMAEEKFQNKKEVSGVIKSIARSIPTSLRSFIEEKAPEDLEVSKNVKELVKFASKKFISLIRKTIESGDKMPTSFTKLSKIAENPQIVNNLLDKKTGISSDFDLFLDTYTTKLKDPTFWEDADNKKIGDLKEKFIDRYLDNKKNENIEKTKQILKNHDTYLEKIETNKEIDLDSYTEFATQKTKDGAARRLFNFPSDKKSSDVVKKMPSFVNMSRTIMSNLGIDKESQTKLLRYSIKNKKNIIDAIVNNIDVVSDYNIKSLYDLGDALISESLSHYNNIDGTGKTEKERAISAIKNKRKYKILQRAGFETSDIKNETNTPPDILGAAYKKAAEKLISKKLGAAGQVGLILGQDNNYTKNLVENQYRISKTTLNTYMTYLKQQDLSLLGDTVGLEIVNPSFLKNITSLKGMLIANESNKDFVSGDRLDQILKLDMTPLPSEFMEETKNTKDKNGKIIKTKTTAKVSNNRSILEDLSMWAKSGHVGMFEDRTKKLGISWLTIDMFNNSKIDKNVKNTKRFLCSTAGYILNCMGIKVDKKAIDKRLKNNNYDINLSIKSILSDKKSNKWKIGNLSNIGSALANPSLNIDSKYAIDSFRNGQATRAFTTVGYNNPQPSLSLASKYGFKNVEDFTIAKASLLQKNLKNGEVVGIAQLPPEVLSRILLTTYKNLESSVGSDLSVPSNQEMEIPVAKINRIESSRLFNTATKDIEQVVDLESKEVPIKDYLSEMGIVNEMAQNKILKLNKKDIEKLHQFKNHDVPFNKAIQDMGLVFKDGSTITSDMWKKNGNKLYHLLEKKIYNQHNFSEMIGAIKLSFLGSINDGILKQSSKNKESLVSVLSPSSKDSCFFQFISDTHNITKDLSKIKTPKDVDIFVQKYNLGDIETDENSLSSFLRLAERSDDFLREMEDSEGMDMGVVLDYYGFYKKNLTPLFPQMLESIVSNKIRNKITLE